MNQATESIVGAAKPALRVEQQALRVVEGRAQPGLP